MTDQKQAKVPEDEAILQAIAGLGERTQRALLYTIWKDSIDIDAPTFDAKKFAEWIARPYIERIASLIERGEKLAAALKKWMPKMYGFIDSDKCDKELSAALADWRSGK